MRFSRRAPAAEPAASAAHYTFIFHRGFSKYRRHRGLFPTSRFTLHLSEDDRNVHGPTMPTKTFTQIHAALCSNLSLFVLFDATGA